MSVAEWLYFKGNKWGSVRLFKICIMNDGYSLVAIINLFHIKFLKFGFILYVDKELYIKHTYI